MSLARIIRWRQGKHSRNRFGYCSYAYPEMSSTTELSTLSPSRYAIEIRDKDFRLKDRLENAVTGLQFEWNRIGGCGRCTFTIEGSYLRVTVAPDDDIRVYLPNESSGATLWYRGYVESVTPAIESGNDGSIRVECQGYFGWMERIIIHNSGAKKTYTNTEVSLIVQDIIDNFIVPNSSITRGTINASTFIPDTMEFKMTAKEALRTCYDLLGEVEYGINASLQFYWYTQSESLTDKFYLGGAVTKISDRVDFKRIVNKIYFEGGDSGGSAYTTTGTAQDSIDRFGLHEEIISNAAIVTNSVANRFISGTFTQRARPQRQLGVTLKNITKRFESSLPIGAISIVDPDVAQARFLWGRTANGGSNLIYGVSANSGSGKVYGGVRKEQIDRIMYSVSPQDGRIDAEINFGSSVAVSRASATIKEIEHIQNTLRQRSL